MGELAGRVYFCLCAALGRLIRAARYSTVRIVDRDGVREVRKERRFYAPFMVWIGGALLRMLDAGVRVLPQQEWEERERELCRSLRRTSIAIDPAGVLALPYLPGETLAALLENAALDESVRRRAIGLAVVALADLHRLGFTHGDAMAENVVVDLDGGVAHWIDFETVHESGRATDWRRADDVRALLMTCVLRTPPAARHETVRLIADAYADQGILRNVAMDFGSVWRRSLAIHLGQARVSLECFREIAGLARGRFGSA